MSKIIKLVDHKKNQGSFQDNYHMKLIRLRDKIEDELYQISLKENDNLAVSLAAGRFSAMHLAKLIGKEETILFFQDCIDTSLAN